MTAPECRDAIVRHVAAAGGWVPIGELAQWMSSELLLSRNEGSNDLRTLVLAGRLECRATRSDPGSWLRAYEYRVPR